MSSLSPDARAGATRHARRAAGQVHALAAMIADDRPFAEVAQQLLAARASLDSLLMRLIRGELCDCVPDREARDQVDGMLRTALGRHGVGRANTRTIPDKRETKSSAVI